MIPWVTGIMGEFFPLIPTLSSRSRDMMLEPILWRAQRDGERLKRGDGEVKVKMPSALGARVGFLAENRFT